MRGSPTVLPVPVIYLLSLGIRVLMSLRGTDASAIGSSMSTLDGPVAPGAAPKPKFRLKYGGSHCQLIVMASRILMRAIQTKAVTEAIWPTLLMRGVKSI